MATASDDFNRANGAIGANWTQDTGTWTVDTNTVRQTTASSSYFKARYTATPPTTNDFEAEVDGRSDDGSIGFGVGVRFANSSAVSGYVIIGFGGDSCYLVRLDAGAENILDTGSGITSSTTFNLRGRANGSTIEGYRNDVLDVNVTDSTYSSGGWGMITYGSLNGANSWMDNFLGADLGAAPAPVVLKDKIFYRALARM